MKYNFDEIIPREGTDALKYDFRKQIFRNENVLPMWVADMDFKTPDFIINALKERLEHPILGYSVRNENFYYSIINWVKKRHNWEIKKPWIGFTPGVVPGLAMAVMAFTKPGDKIIIQTPVYHPFHSTVKDLGRQLVENELLEKEGKYSIDFDALEKQMDSRTKLLFFSNPHNPVGRVWTIEEPTQLGELCVKKEVIIIADDIHSDLILKPYQYVPIATISDEIAAKTLTFIAPSKTFNVAGLSSSVAISSNPKILNEFNQIVQDIHVSGGNLFGNVGLTAAYEHGEEWLEEMLVYLKGNFDYLKSFLSENLPKIKVSEMEGTYLAWLDFRAFDFSQDELNDILINKANLGFNSGHIFGVTGNGFMRINLACSRIIVEKALASLKIVFSEL